jgi:hypothetical protein
MTTENVIAPGHRWTAEEVRRLPAAQRSEILRAAAELAAIEYETDPELTAFEAFGESDLYADSSDTITE